MADHDKDKGNLSTVDRSHQLTLTFPHQHTIMTAIFQQPIICPLACIAAGHHLVIKFTTGWLLGTIACWDGREHTPSLGFGHYPSTYEVLSVFILLDRTLIEGL